MTIKAILYVEKNTIEYLDVINCFLKVSNLELSHFIYSENTPIKIDGLTQFNGSMLNLLQQSKCETIFTLSLSQTFVEAVTKIITPDSRIYVILIPMKIDIVPLVKLKDFSTITVFTCLPLRHLSRVFKSRESLKKVDSSLQYIEGKLIAPVLSYRYNLSRQHINVNHLYLLVMVDVIHFISNRTFCKVQALSRAVEWEMRSEHRNEKHLDDYSVIIGHFKQKDSDKKPSLTSKSGATLLPPKTALIKIKSGFTGKESVSFKIKVKSTDESIKFFYPQKSGDDDGKGSEEVFWNSKLVQEGVEAFMRHVEHVRQQNAPRLVDFATLSEDEFSTAKTSLISVMELLQLCSVVEIVDKAAQCGQTVVLE